MEKQYVIRKYVLAKNVTDALKKERDIRADEAWIDEDWKKQNPNITSKEIGFKK